MLVFADYFPTFSPPPTPLKTTLLTHYTSNTLSHTILYEMDLPGGLNLEDIIPIIVIGVAQASRDEKTPRRTPWDRDACHKIFGGGVKRLTTLYAR